MAKAYFMETGIFLGNEEQPPRKTKISVIGDRLNFDLDTVAEDEEISVLSEEGNWYTIKKKDLIFED